MNYWILEMQWKNLWLLGTIEAIITLRDFMEHQTFIAGITKETIKVFLEQDFFFHGIELISNI